jgi:predicted transcriptional regulator
MAYSNQRAALLLAIKPRWSTMLLDKAKTVEFRRRGPGQVAIGMQVLLYASAPISALVGYGLTLDCVRDDPAGLWTRYAGRGGIAEHDFAAYFEGASVGDALLLDCRPLPHSVHLDMLRARYNWRPPMSWSWLRATSPLLAFVPTRQT